MTARERAMTEATDEEVAAMRTKHGPHPGFDGSLCGCLERWPCSFAKLLARLERVEEELDTMKLGHRGFP